MTQFWHTLSMHFALSLFWIVLSLAFAIGTVMMIIGLVRAPEGYEDAEGFKYATEGGVDAAHPVAHPSHARLA